MLNEISSGRDLPVTGELMLRFATKIPTATAIAPLRAIALAGHVVHAQR
jgi:hypothetical protein